MKCQILSCVLIFCIYTYLITEPYLLGYTLRCHANKKVIFRSLEVEVYTLVLIYILHARDIFCFMNEVPIQSCIVGSAFLKESPTYPIRSPCKIYVVLTIFVVNSCTSSPLFTTPEQKTIVIFSITSGYVTFHLFMLN